MKGELCMDRQILKDSGIEYEQGLEKFLDMEDLYNGLLKDFLDDNSFEEAKAAVEAMDYDTVHKTVHAMKSVTGTLCMNELYEKCCEVIDYLRNARLNEMEQAFKEAYELYQKVTEGIKKGLD
jgi:HPt (histidine-containing phosphotransfer) domain-containing protein